VRDYIIYMSVIKVCSVACSGAIFLSGGHISTGKVSDDCGHFTMHSFGVISHAPQRPVPNLWCQNSGTNNNLLCAELVTRADIVCPIRITVSLTPYPAAAGVHIVSGFGLHSVIV